MRVYQGAVCEDQPQELRYIASALQEALQRQNLPVDLRGYTEGAQLLKDIGKLEQPFDLFFLILRCRG